ncbi:vWA domain-containing protein [Halobellus captivus]|uniref:vWA domain-containing protein n=1 Tax=Halobellus captivus TaxID=2592614 RepID=UPI0011A21ECD|nr:vWA domain-containing protein [Halobellus captivus]
MTEYELDLTRRKVLGSIGAIGAASAGAGLGTSALFSDTESFENNTITAGTLDLKVDWQQSYYGASESWEFVNAHPDHDDDGEQSIDLGGNTGVVKYSDDDKNIVDALTCENFDQNYEENFGDQESLVSLNDVKPGDEGEITFSLHLCDNPGYIWLTADNFSQSGGTTTEPEEAELEQGEEDDGELAENTFVEIWYDEDCDNQLDRSGEEGQELEVALVSDRSGSMSGSIGDLETAAKNFVDQLSTPDEGAAISFANGASLDQELTTDYQAIKDAIDYTADGSTDMSDGISTAHDELMSGTNATPGANKVMIVLGDGDPDSESDTEDAADDAKDDGIRIFTIALGDGPDEDFMEGIASNPSDAYAAPDSSDLQTIYDEIAQVVISGEQVILGEGDGEHDDPVTLAEAMDIIQNNGGMVPLDGDGDMGYDDGDTAEARDCFDPETGHCIGVHWWVPTDVGNEIQGDSVDFDLGFYAQQCRNSDGSRPEASV